jgi:XapX domain-containing protein
MDREGGSSSRFCHENLPDIARCWPSHHGVIYSLLNVRSPAPPLVALIGLRVAGEQIIPVAKQMIAGEGLAAAWRQANCSSHMFGMLPGRQADEAKPTANVPEKAS